MTTKWIGSNENTTIEKIEKLQFEWKDYHNGIYSDYDFVEQNEDAFILYDQKKNIYLKLTDTDLKWGRTKENINYLIDNGKWEIREGKLFEFKYT